MVTRTADWQFVAGFEPPTWLEEPWCIQLNAAFGEGAWAFVGGAVRDSLLGRPIGDIDVATLWPPEEAARKLESKGVRTLPTGIEHGTITALFDGRTVEITTLRRDVSTDGRRAVVAFTKDWAEDARRRDFTINAIYMDGRGRLLDSVGGIDDLRRNRVRFVGDAHSRVAEDGLRVLRFFRFSAIYGAGAVDAEGLAAVTERQDALDHVSAERRKEELFKWLMADDPLPTLRAAYGAGILKKILPCAVPEDLDRFLNRAARLPLTPDPVTRLFALTVSCAGDIRWAADWRLSRREYRRLKELHSALQALHTFTSLEAFAYYHDPEAAVIASLCGSVETVDAKQLSRLLASKTPDFPLKGNDLKSHGLSEGRQLGACLRKLEQFWVDSGFTLTKDELLQILGKMGEVENDG